MKILLMIVAAAVLLPKISFGQTMAYVRCGGSIFLDSTYKHMILDEEPRYVDGRWLVRGRSISMSAREISNSECRYHYFKSEQYTDRFGNDRWRDVRHERNWNALAVQKTAGREILSCSASSSFTVFDTKQDFLDSFYRIRRLDLDYISHVHPITEQGGLGHRSCLIDELGDI